ncbi:MAG: cytochrome c1 [Acidiferrobacteraceae bacterium]|nr:cytochrome c1 [Acidiferrobacteraceae bacterium]
MKKLLGLLFIVLIPFGAVASGGSNENLDTVHIDLSDTKSLQRGARTFVNYCLSCHGASYMRYERMAKDLKISDSLLRENLMFAADKPGELMMTTMPAEGAKQWFGVVPPDLSVTARYRRPDWIYTYLRSFYIDESSPTGWDNLVFPNVAMPNVLYRWQGGRIANFSESDGNKHFEGFEQLQPGEMTQEEFDLAIQDLTNFMVYLAEPAKLVRYRIGLWVIIFMVIFTIFAYFLYKEYWRDVR